VAKSLQKAGTRVKIVLLILHEDQELIAAAGCRSFRLCHKDQALRGFGSAVEEVLEGNTFISAQSRKKS
jgi:DNA-binding NarL/FixJ family response regulator